MSSQKADLFICTLKSLACLFVEKPEGLIIIILLQLHLLVRICYINELFSPAGICAYTSKDYLSDPGEYGFIQFRSNNPTPLHYIVALWIIEYVVKDVQRNGLAL